MPTWSQWGALSGGWAGWETWMGPAQSAIAGDAREVGIPYFDLAVQEANGKWLSLNDHIRYTVGGDSFNQMQMSQRRIMATSPYLAGEYQVHSVPGNATESVTIYASGGSWQDCQNNVYRLLDAFMQPKFLIRKDLEANREMWACWTAEYNIQYSRVYVANRYIPVQFQVPRLPQIAVMERSL